MSVPADVILTWGRYEELLGEDGKPVLEHINKWLLERGQGRDYGFFHPLPDEFDNGYVSAENIYCGSLNYFAPDELLLFLRGLAWNEPENVQLFVRGYEDEKFEMFTLDDYQSRDRNQGELAIEQDQFANQVFAFDGELTIFSKERWGEIIEEGRGHVTFSVNARTTCLLGGYNCDEELAKAHRLGIPVVWERDLYVRLNNQNKS